MPETIGDEQRKKQQGAIAELLIACKHFKAAGDQLSAARANAHTVGISDDDIEYFERAADKGWL